MKRISLLFLVLSACWMSTIFYFSSMDDVDSTQESISVGLWIGNIFISDFDTWTESEQIEFAEKIDHPVRKCAHATEYAMLGILVFFTMKSPNKYWIWICWLICILYASSDEFHQLFVPGRSGQISDVCLDSLGALVGILFGKGIRFLKQRAVY